MCTFVCDWVFFLEMGIRTGSETTFAQSKVYRNKGPTRHRGDVEMNTISQEKGSNKGQSVYWDVRTNALFAPYGVYSRRVAVLLTLCLSGHLVGISGRLWGAQTIIYTIMVELAQRLRCSHRFSTKIFTVFL